MTIQRRSIHWSLHLGQAAFSLILLGIFMLGGMIFNRPDDSTVDQLEQLPALSRAELLAAPRATDVLIEGRVSDRNEVLGHGFVAYTRELGSPDYHNDIVWHTDEYATPALIIDLADGPVTMAGNYTLSGDVPVITEGDYRYHGLAAGDPVIVIGRPTYDKTEEQILPGEVIRGTRTSYPRPGPDSSFVIIALGLLAAGGAIMAWLLRRGYKPWGSPKTGR
jgi:hypothetical protein